MKALGLLGGMSWESPVPYYRLINQGVSERLGGLNSAFLVLASVDFADIARMQSSGAWQEAGEVLSERAQALRQAGAQGIVLCINTMHKVADIIMQRCPLPLLHIANATAVRIHRVGVRRVSLLGTRFTMEEAFFVTGYRRHMGWKWWFRGLTSVSECMTSFLPNCVWAFYATIPGGR